MLNQDASDILARSAGAPLVGGNAVRVLCDADENYGAWAAAVESARRTVHLEMYIVHDDPVGRQARDLLVARARAGVTVRVLYDWFGSLRLTSRRFWRPLVEAGGEVRTANPPSMKGLFALASRDHRKLLAVDGTVAFISGLCIGEAWIGDPRRNIVPWRDTGVEVRGPAVADAEASFAAVWALWGSPIPAAQLPAREAIGPVGPVAVRVIATAPDGATLYRTQLAVAALARQRLWVTDAYFIGTATYIEALRAAARDGVDVRLLVPNKSDIQWIANYSRSLYHPLLEAGVRVFEWNGSMVHAKTAVADGQWARIGSSNLNWASWLGNWELDVAIEDAGVGREMEVIFERDLANSTEIVITSPHRVRPVHPGRRRPRAVGGSGGRGGRVMSDVAAVRGMLGATVRGYRTLGRPKASSLLLVGLAVLGAAALCLWFPRLVAYPVAAILLWEGLVLVVRSWRLRLARRSGGASS